MTAEKQRAQQLFDRVAFLVRSAAQQKAGILIYLEGANLPAIKRIAKRLARILDPRHFRVLRIPQRRTSRGALTMLQPYWVSLPAYGDTVIHEHSYYHSLALVGDSKKSRIEAVTDEIRAFESTLAADKYVIVKLLLDSDPQGLKEHFSDLKRHVRRLIKERFKAISKGYDSYTTTLHKLVALTDQPGARWFQPPPKKDLTTLERSVLEHLVATLEERLGVDSMAGVEDFDRAMEERRRKRSEANVPSGPA